MKCKSHHIFSSVFVKLSIYLLKKGGWSKSGMIWMKIIYGMKLREALPNRRQIHSKSEFWEAIFEHLNR
jgi:hypothetical protein